LIIENPHFLISPETHISNESPAFAFQDGAIFSLFWPNRRQLSAFLF
jgi:hypothetical protein